MLKLIEGLPDGVVGLEAVGEVTADDYDAVTAVVDRMRVEHGKLRLLHVLGERFTGYTKGGMWDDAKLGLTHPRSWERVAVVTDLGYMKALVKGLAWSLPGGMKLFANADRATAEAWLREGLEHGG